VDPTSTLSTSSQTLAKDVALVLHFIWGPGTRKVYANGVEIGTTTTYEPEVLPADIYLGSSSSVIEHMPAVFNDFTVFETDMTATQVLDDYNSVLQVAGQGPDGQRVGAIPWLWTKDGDDVVDNHDDSGEDNWCVCGGMPGSDAGETQIQGALSSNWSVVKELSISRLAVTEFAIPTELMFLDQSGTADAGSSGGAYKLTSVSATGIVIGNNASALTYPIFHNLLGQEWYMLFRLHDEGAALTCQFAYQMGGNEIRTDFLAYATTAAFRLFLSLPLFIATAAGLLNSPVPGDTTLAIRLNGKRTSGTANVRLDYMCLLPRPLIRISETVLPFAGFVLKGLRAVQIDATTKSPKEIMTVEGDVLELVPNALNILISLIGNETIDPAITYTLTYNRVEITPRYSLL
jgi:hypothetical protein